jgi:hypothetical protein
MVGHGRAELDFEPRIGRPPLDALTPVRVDLAREVHMPAHAAILSLGGAALMDRTVLMFAHCDAQPGERWGRWQANAIARHGFGALWQAHIARPDLWYP